MKNNLTSKRQQLKDIAQQIDTCIRHKVECCICATYEHESDIAQEEFARLLYGWGWRNAVSEKFQTEGLMCSDCFATPDKDRGED